MYGRCSLAQTSILSQLRTYGDFHLEEAVTLIIQRYVVMAIIAPAQQPSRLRPCRTFGLSPMFKSIRGCVFVCVYWCVGIKTSHSPPDILIHLTHLFPMTGSTNTIEDSSEGLTLFPGWGQTDHKNADLKIISSDSHIFWVSSTLLGHHSWVLPRTLDRIVWLTHR